MRPARRPRWKLGKRARVLLGSGVVVVTLVNFIRDQLEEVVRAPVVETFRQYPLSVQWSLLGLLVLVAALLGYLRYRNRRVEVVNPQGSELNTLPPLVPGFFGRDDDIGRIRSEAKRYPAVVLVGDRGAGTSALLSVAAHELRVDYHDAQVYVDVRGSGRYPLTAEQVLARVCHKLGLPAPDTGDEARFAAAADRLRSWLAGKQVLLVLDNVDDSKQVRDLLPVPTGSLVLLAGNSTPAGVARVAVHPLSDEEAVHLLQRDDAPQEVGGLWESALRLVRLCERQPLAIRLVRAQLVDLRWSAESLAHAIERTAWSAGDVRDDGQVDGNDLKPTAALRRLWSICDLGYQKLGEPSQRVFRLLALVPDTEVDVPTVSALVGLDRSGTEKLLRELAALEFIEPVVDRQRYRLRNLLRPVARHHLLSSETRRDRHRALSRLVGYLVRAATQQADALALVPQRGTPEQGATRRQAGAWFSWRHDLLYRMVTDWPDVAPDRLPMRVQRGLFEIAVALCQWYATESRLPADWQRVCDAVGRMRPAQRDESIAAWVHNELAVVHRLQADPTKASEKLVRASQLPYRWGTARAQILTNQGLVQIDQRHVQEAVGTLERARRLRGDRYGKALTDVALSAAHLYGNKPDLAQSCADRCRRGFTRVDDTVTTADVGELRVVAAALNNLGLALWRQGDHLGPKENWNKAYEIYHELDDAPGKARVQLNRAAMLLTRDPSRADEAIAWLKESLELRGASPASVGTGLCHLHMGHAYAQKQRLADACAEWQRASRIFIRLGVQPEADEARRLIKRHGCGDVPPPLPPRNKQPTPHPTGFFVRLRQWWSGLRRGPGW
jgi:tetratricopeptide (TPR) repeat protein